MKANFCFDFVVRVADHDASVTRYRDLFGIDPIELARDTLPDPTMRCTIFPLWDLGDRGMVFSLVSSTDPESALSRQIEAEGEGLMLFGVDVDDVGELVRQGKKAGVEFHSEEPAEYDYGHLVYSRPDSTSGIPMVFSTHKPGWWAKSLAGGHPKEDETG